MMFYSFIQIRLLVLALCSLGLARGLSEGNGLTVPAQRPMLHFRPAASKGKLEYGRDATIKLFPPSQLAFRSSSSLDCKAIEFNTITLGTDVCLSGDYYLKHNMLVTEAPICPDGSIPTMRFYAERACVGIPTFGSTVKPDPEYCLWGGIAPKYWSLIFRCGPDASSAEGADKHELAIPPATSNSGKIYSGRVSLSPECVSGRTRGWGRLEDWQRPRQYLMQTDTCIVMDGDSITIKREAICPDGKRARWARFETTNCNGGHVSERYGLVDIHDTDIGRDQCLITSQDKAEDKIRSVAFWCEGVKVGPPMNELAWGTYSEEACSEGGTKPTVSWNGIKRVQPDKCIPKDLGTSFTVLNPGWCANGTRANLAFYKDDSCGGQPDHFSEVRFNTMNICSQFPGIASWAFFCEGVSPPPTTSAKEGFYNREACLQPENGRKPTPWMGFPAQAKPDTCNMRFAYPFNLSIALPATCANGTQASVALFKDESCATQPISFRTIGNDGLNRCEHLPEVGSWAFWCDGEGLGQPRTRVEIVIDEDIIARPKSLATHTHTGSIILPTRIPAKLAPVGSADDSALSPNLEIHAQVLPPGATPDRPKVAKPIHSIPSIAKVEVISRPHLISRPVPTDSTTEYSPEHASHSSPGMFSNSPCSDTRIPQVQITPQRSCHTLGNQPFRVFSPSTCPNGRPALVALYQDRFCRFKPDQFAAFDIHSANQCLYFAGINSWEFWCSDVGESDVRLLKDIAVKIIVPGRAENGSV